MPGASAAASELGAATLQLAGNPVHDADELGHERGWPGIR